MFRCFILYWFFNCWRISSNIFLTNSLRIEMKKSSAIARFLLMKEFKELDNFSDFSCCSSLSSIILDKSNFYFIFALHMEQLLPHYVESITMYDSTQCMLK